MNTVLSTTELMQQLGRLQDMTQQFEQPWKPIVESYGKMMQKINLATYDRIMETYSSLADLYRIPDYLDGTRFLRPDTEDGAEDDTVHVVFATTREEFGRILKVGRLCRKAIPRDWPTGSMPCYKAKYRKQYAYYPHDTKYWKSRPN